MISMLSFAMIIMLARASDLCGICNCDPYEEYFIISCKGYKNHMPEIELESLEWPKNDFESFKAFFNNVSLHLLPK